MILDWMSSFERAKTVLLHTCRTVLVASLLLPSAYSTASAQEPSAASIAMAKELLEIKGATTMFDPLVPGVIETTKNTFLTMNPGLSKDLNDVSAQLRNELGSKRVELQNEVAKVYASAFTEQEIREALAFYRSPLGKKISTEEPRVLDKIMSNAQDWADKLADDVLARFRVEMRKKGHTL
jgi:hypothetical protein